MIFPLRAVRHEGQGGDGPQQAAGFRRGRGDKAHDGHGRFTARHLVETAVALALVPQALHIDIRHGGIAGQGKAFPFGQRPAVFKYAGISAENQVAGAFAKACARVGIARVQAPALLAEQLPAVVLLADQRVAGAGVHDHVRALHGILAAGGDGRPQILADFHGKGKITEVKQQVRREGATHPILLKYGFRLRCADKPAGFVKFVAVGQIGFGHQAPHLPALQHRRAVEKTAALVDGQPHHHGHIPGLRGDGFHGGERRALYRLPAPQIAPRVAGDAQLRKHGHPHAL